MTTLTVNTVTVVGTQVTIVGTLSAQTFPIQNQQTSIGDIPTFNTNWSRNIQISSQGIFCKRYGAQSFAMLLPSFSEIAYNINPSLTFTPMLGTEPSSQSVPHGTTAIFSVSAITEVPITGYQWQSSPDNVTWTNITNGGSYSGATTTTLGINPATIPMSGTMYRCQVTNVAGTTISTVATLTVT